MGKFREEISMAALPGVRMVLLYHVGVNVFSIFIVGNSRCCCYDQGRLEVFENSNIHMYAHKNFILSIAKVINTNVEWMRRTKNSFADR